MYQWYVDTLVIPTNYIKVSSEVKYGHGTRYQIIYATDFQGHKLARQT